MPRQNRKSAPTLYDPSYTHAEFNTMKRYGNGDLYNEVGLLRVLMDRALAKMNTERKTLTFKDHLSALNAFSRSTGRVAYLMHAQNKIFPPIEEVRSIVGEFRSVLDKHIESLIDGYESKGEEVPPELEFLQAKLFWVACGMENNENWEMNWKQGMLEKEAEFGGGR